MPTLPASMVRRKCLSPVQPVVTSIPNQLESFVPRRSMRQSSRRLAACGVLCAASFLTGCGDFFHADTGTGDSTGTDATNYVFVANAGANTVTGLGISTDGVLASLTGSPISLSEAPTALAVSRSNNYLWVGTASEIFGYAISSTGALTTLNNGAALSNTNCIAMETSPDGKWLLVLDGTGILIDLFAINSDGTLTATTGISFQTSGTAVPRDLRMNPAGTVVAAAMGTAGELLFSFDTSTGALAQLSETTPPSLTSDNGIAWDPAGSHLYLARSGSSGGLVVETVGASGTLTPTTSTPYSTGTQAYSVTLDAAGSYVYVANRGDSTITGYAVGTDAALTAIAGSPFSSGLSVTQLGVDSTGKWLLAAAYDGSPDLTLYGFDSSNAGRIYTVSSSGTGTNASFLGLSH